MPMQRAILSRAARLLLLPLAVLAAACDREATSSAGGLPDDLAPGIYSLFAVTGSGPGATVDLYLKQVRVPGRLASYQGEITFDAGAMTLKAAELPEGVIGTAREVAPGRVRFSGAAVDGLGDAPALTLRFSRRGEMTAGTFKLSIEEVADADFGDLTPKVSAAAPFFQAR